eukprot:CAMPEP_0198367470 /NCGR_PEP_ID=MMETSP1450-20131203/155185_1 /TAXON_ID=753684 ORGANISM="Madagascaria erythrocladiodes, Strain CCMP3234" /NCGR_SAMPLE_ID=MMETSP1450 /ASSEMBLY_ACC=CAM_ASM_001115 /LENGTH=957 /DNA_ID=CAMNT_0044074953 /DNA_START=127 /DNA_END=3003 /DNA_ORIENTATION=-
MKTFDDECQRKSGNGRCDSECNLSAYQFDGGDCCRSSNQHACLDQSHPNFNMPRSTAELNRRLGVSNRDHLAIVGHECFGCNYAGRSTFPWDSDRYSSHRGIHNRPMLMAFDNRGARATSPRITHNLAMQHEVGHMFGLHHTHVGGECDVDCGQHAAIGDANYISFLQDDLVNDTKAGPVLTRCSSSQTQSCSGRRKRYQQSHTNMMAYGGQFCRATDYPNNGFITRMQAARMRCFVDELVNWRADMSISDRERPAASYVRPEVVTTGGTRLRVMMLAPVHYGGSSVSALTFEIEREPPFASGLARLNGVGVNPVMSRTRWTSSVSDWRPSVKSYSDSGVDSSTNYRYRYRTRRGSGSPSPYSPWSRPVRVGGSTLPNGGRRRKRDSIFDSDWPLFVGSPLAIEAEVNNDIGECSSGCAVGMLANGACDSECNNDACHFDNGDCRPPPPPPPKSSFLLKCESATDGRCTKEKLKNDICDEGCAVPVCNFDHWHCIDESNYPNIEGDSGSANRLGIFPGCPNDCHNRGQCFGSRCVCMHGYSGSSCGTPTVAAMNGIPGLPPSIEGANTIPPPPLPQNTLDSEFIGLSFVPAPPPVPETVYVGNDGVLTADVAGTPISFPPPPPDDPFDVEEDGGSAAGSLLEDNIVMVISTSVAVVVCCCLVVVCALIFGCFLLSVRRGGTGGSSGGNGGGIGGGSNSVRMARQPSTTRLRQTSDLHRSASRKQLTRSKAGGRSRSNTARRSGLVESRHRLRHTSEQDVPLTTTSTNATTTTATVSRSRRNTGAVKPNATTTTIATYKCDVCGATYATSADVVIHKQKRHPTYDCEICGAVYATKEDVEIHKSKRHADSGTTTSDFYHPLSIGGDGGGSGDGGGQYSSSSVPFRTTTSNTYQATNFYGANPTTTSTYQATTTPSTTTTYGGIGGDYGATPQYGSAVGSAGSGGGGYLARPTAGTANK